jgi:hypothetical protein
LSSPSSWRGHWHGFVWTGNGAELKDSQRRPQPDVGYLSSDVPPLVTGHWLLKPPRQIRGTWADPTDAVSWLREEYGAQPPPGGPDLLGMVANAEDTLSRGNDVTWAYWQAGTRFVHLTVVSCPNRFHPAIRCPNGRS